VYFRIECNDQRKSRNSIKKSVEICRQIDLAQFWIIGKTLTFLNIEDFGDQRVVLGQIPDRQTLKFIEDSAANHVFNLLTASAEQAQAKRISVQKRGQLQEISSFWQTLVRFLIQLRLLGNKEKRLEQQFCIM
jgi:hypothetical protein